MTNSPWQTGRSSEAWRPCEAAASRELPGAWAQQGHEGGSDDNVKVGAWMRAVIGPVSTRERREIERRSSCLQIADHHSRRVSTVLEPRSLRINNLGDSEHWPFTRTLATRASDSDRDSTKTMAVGPSGLTTARNHDLDAKLDGVRLPQQQITYSLTRTSARSRSKRTIDITMSAAETRRNQIPLRPLRRVTRTVGIAGTGSNSGPP